MTPTELFFGLVKKFNYENFKKNTRDPSPEILSYLKTIQDELCNELKIETAKYYKIQNRCLVMLCQI